MSMFKKVKKWLKKPKPPRITIKPPTITIGGGGSGSPATTTEQARSFIRLDGRGSCGPFGGRMIYLVSTHDKKRIAVTVVTRWMYNGESRSDAKLHELVPKGEIALGCNIPGPTGQTFNHEISSDARFV